MSPVANVIKNFVGISNRWSSDKNLKVPKSRNVDLVQCFSIKMGGSHLRIRGKAEKLAYQMKYGFWSLLNFVGIPAVGNSDKKNIYNIGHWKFKKNMKLRIQNIYSK